MKELPAIIYLHGLGSSPQSPKARLFAEHFTALGYEVVIPALSLPSLQHLSVRAAVEQTGLVLTEVTKRSAVILIGSSFGGFVAVYALSCLSASVMRPVRGLVLLARCFTQNIRTSRLLPKKWNLTGKRLECFR